MNGAHGREPTRGTGVANGEAGLGARPRKDWRAIANWELPSPWRRWFAILLIMVGSTWLTQFLWHENLSADWGMIDDHDVMAYLGPDKTITASEGWSAYKRSEAFSPGSSLRYRPSYAALRFFEIWLWGDSAHSWYVARNCLAWILVAASWVAMARFAGVLLGGAFVLLMMKPGYWGDVFARLGPAETYAAAGLALFACGCAWLWRPDEGLGTRADRALRHVAWIVAMVGALAAMGSKENFVFLPAILLVAAIRDWHRGRLVWTAVAANLVVASFAGLVVWASVKTLSARKFDIYGHEVIGEGAMMASFKALQAFGVRWTVAGLTTAVACVAGGVALVREDFRPWAARLWALVAVEGAIAALIAMQAYFYRGHWNASTRYAVPGEILFLLLWFVPLTFVVRWMAPALVPYRAAAWMVTLAVCVVLVQPVLRDGFRENRRAALRNRLITQHYMTSIHRLLAEARANPRAAIVLRPHSVGEIEGAGSLRRMLLFERVTNPIVVVRPSQLAQGTWSDQGASVLIEIWERIFNGQEPGFSPPEALRDAPTCIELSTSHEPPGTAGCGTRLGVLWKEPLLHEF